MSLKTMAERLLGRPRPAVAVAPAPVSTPSCSNDDVCCFTGQDAGYACDHMGACGCKALRHPADMETHCRA